MDRRRFLTLAGAAGVLPALPASAVRAAAGGAGYNRYTYGLAVFHARTRASLSAADLIARLKVNAVQAEAMIGEMTASGVVRPVLSAAGGAVQAISPQPQALPGRDILRKAADWVSEDAESAEPAAEATDAEPGTGTEADADQAAEIMQMKGCSS